MLNSNFAHRLIFSAISLCLVFPGSAWALFEDNGARRAINEILTRLQKIEERIELLENTNQGQLTIVDSLSDKDKEIARLRGEIEVAQNKINRLESDYETLYTQLDKRLSKLEPKNVELDGEIISVPPSEYKDYQEALAHFKDGNFEQAQQAFELFLENYQESTLGPQVRYFIGSCQFALGNYKEALETQRDLVAEYPNSSRAPDALLSVASSQLALKAVNNAKKTLEQVIKSFPASAAAQSAKDRLDALQ